MKINNLSTHCIGCIRALLSFALLLLIVSTAQANTGCEISLVSHSVSSSTLVSSDSSSLILDRAKIVNDISNLVRISIYNSIEKKNESSLVHLNISKEIVSYIFSDIALITEYLSVVIGEVPVASLESTTVGAYIKSNFNLNEQQLRAVFLLGKSHKSKRKAINAKLNSLEELLPKEILALSKSLYLKFSLYMAYSLKSEFAGQVFKGLISPENIILLDAHLLSTEDIGRELLPKVYYPASFTTPNEFLSFEAAPQPYSGIAQASLLRVFLSEDSAGRGITLIKIGQGDRYLTLVHNIRYLEGLSEGALGSYRAPKGKEGFVNVSLEIEKIYDVKENSEMSVAIVRVPELRSNIEPAALAVPKLGEQIHVYGFPAFRKLVISADNDGVAKPNYSTGSITNVSDNGFTVDALSTMGSSGSVALNTKGEVVGVLWDMSPSFRSSKANSEEILSAYNFGNLLTDTDYSYFVSLDFIAEP